MTRFSKPAALAVIIGALIVAGCSTPKPVETTAPPESSGPTAVTSSSTVVPGSAEDLRVNVGDTVHFAYNEYNIEDNDKDTLQRQAAWLQKYPSIRVTVE